MTNDYASVFAHFSQFNSNLMYNFHFCYYCVLDIFVTFQAAFLFHLCPYGMKTSRSLRLALYSQSQFFFFIVEVMLSFHNLDINKSKHCRITNLKFQVFLSCFYAAWMETSVCLEGRKKLFFLKLWYALKMWNMLFVVS